MSSWPKKHPTNSRIPMGRSKALLTDDLCKQNFCTILPSSTSETNQVLRDANVFHHIKNASFYDCLPEANTDLTRRGGFKRQSTMSVYSCPVLPTVCIRSSWYNRWTNKTLEHSFSLSLALCLAAPPLKHLCPILLIIENHNSISNPISS